MVQSKIGKVMDKIPTDETLPIKHVRVTKGKDIINVGYVDIGPPDGPILLIIHGAIGGIEDFTNLFEPLTSAGNRVLVPEFPGKKVLSVSDYRYELKMDKGSV